MAKPDLVFVGIRGSVVAMDKNTGGRAWETKLKSGSFVTILVDEDKVLAGTQGEIFCLDAATGKLLWHDPLKGYGLGLMSIATKSGSSGLVASAAEHDREQSSSSGDAGAAAAG